MIDDYLRSLAVEYLQLCKMMSSGQYDGADYRELSAQRTNTHNELIRLLGSDYERPFDMQAHCRQLLADAPARPE